MNLINAIDVSDLKEHPFPAVRVAGEEIHEDRIAAELQYHPADEIGEAWHQASCSLVIRELLLRQAAELGIEDDLDEEQRIAALIDQVIDVPEPDDANCRRFFDANPEQFRTPTLLAVSHILLAAAPDDIVARSEQEDTGRRLIASLADGRADFARLALAHSACESRKQGGQLGQIAKGQTVEEFERVVWRLPEGLHSQLVESRYGWHVVRVDRRIEGQPLSYELAKSTIRRYLQEKVTRRWLRQYIQTLALEYGVEGVDLELPDSPLMQ
ncbi:peptidylprolyl isomerase [Marinobacter halodurans]|uniref:peptidylprolyl isomerase n=1 Tax=Marinobacter halodurans TaxID=2528979 RepID=A0ABY1ZJZ6_9GAMM|nr:peptidylprolyl isomerase [Marinobacter halodurans]TBW55720.1 peptidylprolyl isomerase [Marinobacter halodurans]